MKLNDEDRSAVVNHRLQRAKETLQEAEDNIELAHWYAAANRLYYACYYAASGLLINNGYSAKTHGGVFGLLGEHFISKGIIGKEQGVFYGKLFELRQKGDYDDWFTMDEKNVLPLVVPAGEFISLVEKLIQNSKDK